MTEYLVLHEMSSGTPPNDHGREDMHIVWADTPQDAAQLVLTAYLGPTHVFSPNAVGRIVGVMRVQPEKSIP